MSIADLLEQTADKLEAAWQGNEAVECRAAAEGHRAVCLERDEAKKMLVEAMATIDQLRQRNSKLRDENSKLRGAESLDVGDMVEHYLRSHGYEGLYNEAGSDGCGCRIDDLIPCGEVATECLPGMLAPCDCGDHNWSIVPCVAPTEKKKP